MQLSRSWSRLLLFWAGIGAVCGVGIAALALLGPASQETPLARPDLADGVAVDFDAPAPTPPSTVEATLPTNSDAPMTETEPPSSLQQATLAVPVPDPAIAPRREPVVTERTLHLRIVRDSERCPTTPCYKWHLIEQRLKHSRRPTLDLAQLQLAPSIREAAEKGEIELIIDATEQHRSIKGRPRVIMVATNLVGVTPRNGQ